VAWYVDPNLPHLTEVAEYKGEASVCLAVTQLGPTRFSRSAATRVLAEWISFFSNGPSPITNLSFVTRTPKRLFDSLASQTQLELLAVKWGDYSDLTPLVGMSRLATLRLAGASSVADLSPLTRLHSLKRLEVESLRQVRDLSPLGECSALDSLELGGDWMSPRIAHVDSVAVLRKMPQLKRLALRTMAVDDHDYSPVLTLPRIEEVQIMKVRGMRPTFEEIKAMKSWAG
jgi:hypothetical protein